MKNYNWLRKKDVMTGNVDLPDTTGWRQS